MDMYDVFSRETGKFIGFFMAEIDNHEDVIQCFKQWCNYYRVAQTDCRYAVVVTE